MDYELEWYMKQRRPKIVSKRKKSREKLRIFVEKIQDIDCSIDSFIDDLIKWYKQPPEPKFGYETFAALTRKSLEVGPQGSNVDVSKWDQILPRLERIQDIFENKGSYFGRIILSESLAHRYVDIFLHDGEPKYKERAEQLYRHAFKLAKKNKQYKNIDSSLMHWGAACLKFGEIENARKLFRSILNRKGPRYKHPTQLAWLRDLRKWK